MKNVCLLILNKISPGQIRELIRFSQSDSLIAKFTSDKQRFRNQKAFGKWLSRGRLIYILTNKNKDLLGIAWFGKKKFPQRDYFQDLKPGKYPFTLAVRTYPPFRGQGKGKKFLRDAFRLFQQSKVYKNEKNRGLWLTTSIDNQGAVKTFKSLGFRQVCDPDSNNKIVMIFSRALRA